MDDDTSLGSEGSSYIEDDCRSSDQNLLLEELCLGREDGDYAGSRVSDSTLIVLLLNEVNLFNEDAHNVFTQKEEESAHKGIGLGLRVLHIQQFLASIKW